MPKISSEERKGKVIDILNKAKGMELYGIYQYMNLHYGLDDMDYDELAKNIKLIAIDEMRHTEMFAERIRELGGEPTSEQSDKVQKGQKPERQHHRQVESILADMQRKRRQHHDEAL